MAKEVTMMIQESCPHCIQARKYIKELQSEHPEYADVKIDMIDELVHPDIADTLDYWYVPTFFVDSKKIHEGTIKKEDVERVFKEALS